MPRRKPAKRNGVGLRGQERWIEPDDVLMQFLGSGESEEWNSASSCLSELQQGGQVITGDYVRLHGVPYFRIRGQFLLRLEAGHPIHRGEWSRSRRSPEFYAFTPEDRDAILAREALERVSANYRRGAEQAERAYGKDGPYWLRD